MEEKFSSLPGVVTSFDQALNTIFMNTRFDNIDVKFPDDDSTPNEGVSDEVSYEKFHKLFHDSLHNSRVLNGVQAYLRKQVISKLSSNPSLKPKTLPSGEIPIVDRMLFSSMHDLLKHRGYHVTLSLLMAETGMERSNNLIKESDMVKFIHLPALRHHYLAKLSDKSTSSTCMLDVVYAYLFQPEAHNATMKEMSCQTDGYGPNYRNQLDKDIRTIYSNYRQETDTQLVASRRGLDDFLHKYKQDLEKEYEEKLESQFAIWKELEITKARGEVRKECELEYKQYRENFLKEIDKHKLLLQEKEWTLEKNYHEKVQSWEKIYYDERQKMLKQLEDNKHTIDMMQYKVTVEKQHLSSQELHYKELEYKYQARENKIMEMEKQLSQDKLSCMEVARKECRQAYALELDELSQKKLDLLSKQLMVDKEKDYIDSYKEKINFYQQEAEKLKRNMVETQVEMERYKAQEEEVYKALSSVYHNTLNHDILDILTGVLQKYKDLEAENAMLSDHKGLLAMLHEKDGEIRLLKETVQNNLFRWETERAQLRKELDDCRAHENQAKQEQQALASQMQALKQIIQEKNQMIEVLSTRRQGTAGPAPDFLSRPAISSTSGYLDSGVKTAAGGYINFSNYNVYPTLATAKVRARPNVEVPSSEDQYRASYDEQARLFQPRQQERSEYPAEARVSPYKSENSSRYLEDSRSGSAEPYPSSRQSSYSDSRYASKPPRNSDPVTTSSGPAYPSVTRSSSQSAVATSPLASTTASRNPPATVVHEASSTNRSALGDRDSSSRLQPAVDRTARVSPPVAAPPAKISPEKVADQSVDTSSVMDTSSNWLVSMNMNATTANSAAASPKDKSSPPQASSTGIADSKDQAKEVSRVSSRTQLVFASDSKDSNEDRADEKQQTRMREDEKLAQIEAERNKRAEEGRLRRAREIEEEEADRERVRAQRDADEAERRLFQEKEEKDRLAAEREAEKQRKDDIAAADRKRRDAEMELERQRREEEREEEERKRRFKIEEEERKRREEEEEKQRKVREEQDAEDEIAAARAKVLARRKQKQSIESMVSQSDEKPPTMSSFNSRGSSDFKPAEEKPTSASQSSSRAAKATINFGSSLGDDDSNDMEVHDASSDSSRGGWL